MSASIIDRRLNGKKKSAVNRQRLLRRCKQQIKRDLEKTIAKRSITEIDQGEQISIPSKDISEPQFQHGKGGHQEYVFPGNKVFEQRDRIDRPESGQGGQGSQASDSGEGTDEFVFTLSREEFLELYFEDLELPDLVKKELAKISSNKYIRAGITTSGTPNNINVVRSMRQALGRRMALSAPKRKRLKEAEAELENLLKAKPQDAQAIEEAQEKVATLKRRVAAVPFIDTIDLRYNTRTKQSSPSSCAVMFCLMDVSGSMDETKKEIAKRFFILLYLFLTRTYNMIELVFIRHHTVAKDVSEEEFFYSRETGGTVVSSALVLMRDIIKKRYPPSEWNIYAAQASDGDNWHADSPYCRDILVNDIMPKLQYFAYVEIMPHHHQSLWEMYQTVHSQYPNFAMQHIKSVADIYPVFRELFKRKVGS